MRKIITLIVLIFTAVLVYSQTPPDLSKITNQKEKVQKWLTYCNNLTGFYDGSKEDFPTLQQAAIKGQELCGNNDQEPRTIFLYLLGFACYNQLKMDTAQQAFEKCLAYAQQNNVVDYATRSAFGLLAISLQSGDTVKTMQYKDVLQNIADSTQSKFSKAFAFFGLGLYYHRKSMFGTSQDYLIKSLQYRDYSIDTTHNKKEKLDYANVCFILCNVYMSMDVPEKAIPILNKGRKFALYSPTHTKLFYNTAIEIYTNPKTENIDTALFYLKQIENITKGSTSIGNELIEPYGNIARTYIRHKEYDLAKRYADIQYANAEKSQMPFFMFQAQYVNGSLLASTGHTSEAISEYEKALPIAQQIGNEQYIDILKQLAQAHSALGQHSKAITYYEKYGIANDELVKERQSLNFADQETRYRTAEKEKTIVLKDQELLFAHKQRLWLIMGILLIAAIAALLIAFYTNKKRTADKLSILNNELNEANQTKAKLFGIISHDLRSPVNQIYQFLRLQQINPEKLSLEEKQKLSGKIQNAAGSLLEAMEDLLLWSKTQMNEFKVQKQAVKLKPIIDGLLQLFSLNIEEKNLTVKADIPEDVNIITDEYYLQTILRNLLQNALKAAPANTSVTISTINTNSITDIVIANDGATFSQQDFEKAVKDDNNMSLSGLGLRLVKELSEKTDSTIQFKDTNGVGTQVVLIVPNR